LKAAVCKEAALRFGFEDFGGRFYTPKAHLATISANRTTTKCLP